MRRIWLAIRVFFAVLFVAGVADKVDRALREEPAAALPEPPKPKPQPAAAPKPVRSDAVTLLSTLQREARFVDFIKEPLEGYSDSQIGAAARDVHRDCGSVLDRLFALRPIVAEGEGAPIEVAAGFDAGRYRLTGNVTGQPPFHGRVVHHGWEATTCQVPVYSGSATAARVVAPVEVELP